MGEAITDDEHPGQHFDPVVGNWVADELDETLEAESTEAEPVEEKDADPTPGPEESSSASSSPTATPSAPAGLNIPERTDSLAPTGTGTAASTATEPPATDWASKARAHMVNAIEALDKVLGS